MTRMSLRSPALDAFGARAGLIAVIALIALAAGAACEPRDRPAQRAPAGAGSAAAGPAVDPWSRTAPAPATPPREPLRRPLLWTAERAGKTTHFLGTMHVGVDAAAQLPAAVWDRLAAAPALAVETDVSDPALTRIGARASGTLRDDLGPTDWERLEVALTPGVARALSDRTAVVPATLLSVRGLPLTAPMDSVLVTRAKGRGQRIVYLETAASQIALLEKHLDVRALRMMLADLPRVERQAREMLAAYVSGDEQRILALAADQRRDALAFGYTAPEVDGMLDDLLYARNAAWLAAIEQLHASGGALVAVGALHLVGPRSVLALLAERGYRVARVEPGR
jgi:uncharacterized protein YbaP (TraB family)